MCGLYVFSLSLLFLQLQEPLQRHNMIMGRILAWLTQAKILFVELWPTVVTASVVGGAVLASLNGPAVPTSFARATTTAMGVG